MVELLWRPSDLEPHNHPCNITAPAGCSQKPGTAFVLISFNPFQVAFKLMGNFYRVTYQGHKGLYKCPQRLQLLFQ